MTFACPRCQKGVLDSDRGVNARCGVCSNYLPAYQCSDAECGATYCAEDLRLALIPNRPPPKLGGGIGDEEETI